MEYCEIHNEEKILWGRHKKCKSCNRDYQRKWFNENREVQARRVKRNSAIALKRNREWLFEYLKDHNCVDCGEKDPVVLTFDHIDPSLKEGNISALVRDHSLKVLIAEVEKCEVRCANCHMRKTAKQFGWYSYMD
jgi:hypothetical protein